MKEAIVSEFKETPLCESRITSFSRDGPAEPPNPRSNTRTSGRNQLRAAAEVYLSSWSPSPWKPLNGSSLTFSVDQTQFSKQQSVLTELHCRLMGSICSLWSHSRFCRCRTVRTENHSPWCDKVSLSLSLKGFTSCLKDNVRNMNINKQNITKMSTNVLKGKK